ncbi:MAG: hypothetical protein H6Q89_297 [Myxococcaceae bacterium]|nr:hypothetical protein [Myxococcaceae bacterium]
MRAKRALVQLSDHALPAAQFARLRKAIEDLGEQRLRHTYQTTFWFDFAAPPSNLVEQAIVALRPSVPGKFAGAEWWLSRMRTSNVQVDFHRDRDERLALGGGPQVHPARSSVLFLNRCRGGLLAVTRAPPNPRNPAMAPDRLAFDLVQPLPNRYVWFDGRLTHGVLDAENQIPGRRMPPEPSLRLTIAINFWKRRPTGIPRFADRRIYSQLLLSQTQ